MVDLPENNRRNESTLRLLVRRELLVLVALAAVVAVTFVATRAAAHASRGLRQRDARRWFEMGNGARRGEQLVEAIDAFRRAAAIDRNVTEYRLALADTLTAAGERAAATQVLLRIRERTPEDPAINLRLARLEAASGHVDVAVRYYQNALYGSWGIDQTAARLDAREELIDYLLDRGQTSRALSELLVLAPNVAPQPAALIDLGDRFQRAGDDRRALDAFTRALLIAPGNLRARAGAGQAAFVTGNYRAAERYLRTLRTDRHLADVYDTAWLVLRSDPLAARLSAAERTARARILLERAVSRLDACLATAAPAVPVQDDATLRSKVVTLQAQFEQSHPPVSHDQIEAAVDAAYGVERALDQRCAPRRPVDLAIVLIAERHEAETS